ncbi:MAG: ParB/RepB/Spo0J family partition protein [Pirellulales bacterium]|nr:ParB/RepB/Spo0J family partition protein [Pirellulales bacterium]
MSKERRLGRGLEALLGRPAPPVAQVGEEVRLSVVRDEDTSAAGGESVASGSAPQQWLPLESVVPNPYQPRKHFDESEITDLCDSIRTHGFLQPIVVRKTDEGFQIIAGERRFRAAKLANWEQVPVQIREVDDRQMAELAIVENVQRKDLNALEKAASFQRYLQEYECTQEELAARIHIDRSTIANLIRLLELPQDIKQMVANGDISQGHARSLLPLGDEHEQRQFADQIKQESLSVRATENLVREHIRHADRDPLSVVDAEGNPRAAAKPASSHAAQLEGQLRLALGTKVDLRQTVKGSGRITIHFKSNEEFERLQAILQGGGQRKREAS